MAPRQTFWEENKAQELISGSDSDAHISEDEDVFPFTEW
jgi:hypothetical protein